MLLSKKLSQYCRTKKLFIKSLLNIFKEENLFRYTNLLTTNFIASERCRAVTNIIFLNSEIDFIEINLVIKIINWTIKIDRNFYSSFHEKIND